MIRFTDLAIKTNNTKIQHTTHIYNFIYNYRTIMIHPLEKYRIEHNLTLQELGDIIGINKGNLSRMIKTGSAIRTDVCDRIKEKIGVDIIPNKKINKQPLTQPVQQNTINPNIEQNQDDLMNRITLLTEQLNELRDDKKTLKKVTEDQSRYIDDLTEEIKRLRSQLGDSKHLSGERTA